MNNFVRAANKNNKWENKLRKWHVYVRITESHIYFVMDPPDAGRKSR